MCRLLAQLTEDKYRGWVKVHHQRWSTIKILRDWKQRAVERPRDVLPADITSSTLRYLRQMACRSAGVTECPCWQGEERITPVGQYPCTGCPTPGVPMREFSQSLFGSVTNSDPENDERVLRRWINGGSMSTDDYRSVLANAWIHRWLGPNQLMNLFNRLVALEASSSVLRHLIKRLRERVSFKRTGIVSDKLDVIAAEIERERGQIVSRLVSRGTINVRRAQNLSEVDKEWLLATDLPRTDG